MAATVKFYLRSPVIPGELSDVQLRYYHSSGKRFIYTFGLQCTPEQWNKRTQRPRANYANARAAAALMDKLAAVVMETHTRFKLEGKIVTNADFKEACDLSTGVQSKDVPSLLKFAEQLRDERKSAGYKNTCYHLAKFLRKYRKANDLEAVDYNFAMKFEEYLIKDGFADNYIAKLTRTFKTIMREARRRGHTKNRTIDDVRFRITEGAADAVYLTLPEIKTLYEYQFENDRLSNARDMLIAACLTGLRYSDWSKIDLNTNIPLKLETMLFLEIPTQKTGTVVFVPILPYTKKILEKHGGRLPVVSDQKTRDYIKEAAELAGISETVSKKQMRGGKMDYSISPKHENMGTHTGRRSFITNLRAAGCPDPLINAMTGHKSKGMTARYDKRTFEAIAPAIVPFLEKIARELPTNDTEIRFL